MARLVRTRLTEPMVPSPVEPTAESVPDSVPAPADVTSDLTAVPARRTPPSRATPSLAYVEDRPRFLEAVSRGFHEDYSEEDWRGESALVEDDRSFGFTVDGRWISTCGAFSRAMTVPGGASVPTAAVTIVTVSPAYRRRGLLRQMMTHQLESIAEAGTEPLALLWASESLIYGRFGYGHATPRLRLSGPTRDLSFLAGVDLGEGSVDEVDRDEFVTAAPGVHAGMLVDRPGALERPAGWWDVILQDSERRRRGAQGLRYALHFAPDGTADGYALFRIKYGDEGADVVVTEVQAGTPAAQARLWRFLLDLDLIRSFSLGNAAVDEPLRLMVANHRLLTSELTDGTYVRIVDVKRALTARTYAAEVDVVLGVTDPILPANEGAWRLQAGPDGARVTRARRQPDLSLGITELGMAYLGGTSLTALLRAGLVVEHRPGRAVASSAAFGWPRAPHCPDFF